jgi:hypothetical protein
MRNCHQGGLLINRVKDPFRWNHDAVIGRNHLDAGAHRRLRVQDVLHRREIQRAGDDLVSLTRGKVEA